MGASSGHWRRRGRADLAWLLRVRWALIGATTGLAIVLADVVHILLPRALIGLLAAAAVSNALLQLLGASRPRGLIGLAIGFDLLLLSAALYLSGGSRNPFAFLFLALVVLAATLLGRRAGLLIAGLSSAAVAVLAVAYIPFVPDHAHAHAHAGAAHHHPTSGIISPEEHLELHAQSMWLVFAGLGGLVVFVVSSALRQREAEVAAAEAARQETDRWAELGLLAGTAAHELGSPLATVAVVARELERTFEGDENPTAVRAAEDARVIREQIERCREVLDEMAAVARREDRPTETFAVAHAVDAAREASLDPVRVAVDVDASARAFGYERATEHVIRGLIDNALEASTPDGTVTVAARSEARRMVVEVVDRGAGVDQSAADRAGSEPFTTKDGLGIGLFLSRALMERIGGTLELDPLEEGGTRATLRLPLEEPAP
ncbi:MAG: HAMP domain-containing sensor histidine kinase [Myxococcota bacterium]